MYALDTNTVLYFFKDVGHVAERLIAIPADEIAIPSVVLFELETGVAKSRDSRRLRRQIDDLVAMVEVLPFGALEARVGARIRAELEQAGNPIGPRDVLIAATTMTHNATLVTHNTAEFARIPDLRLDDWYTSP